MRLAILADVHGNPIALDAVLADVEAQGGADGYWVLGDLVAHGPDPVSVLERLARLPGGRLVRGNTDRYVATGDREPPSPEEVRAAPRLLDKHLMLSQGLAWTQGCLTQAGWLDRLATLPPEQRLTLPDGTRLLGVHAAPGRDGGRGVDPALSDADLEGLVAGCGADLVCAGHTHWPLDRRASGVRVVNVGSVSNPVAPLAVPDLRACYVLLDASEAGYRLRHRRVAYDLAAAIAAVRYCRYPGAEWVVDHFLGRKRGSWLTPAPAPFRQPG
jgi:predicted phosphodiesterase